MSKLLKYVLLSVVALSLCLVSACGSKTQKEEVKVATPEEQEQAAENLLPQERQAIDNLRQKMGIEPQQKQAQ